MDSIKKVNIFEKGQWYERDFEDLISGDVFRIHRDDETIIDKKIWIAISNFYPGVNFRNTIDCEEFKGELKEENYLREFVGHIESLDDRITALEENKKTIYLNEPVITNKGIHAECLHAGSLIIKSGDASFSIDETGIVTLSGGKITLENKLTQLEECITPNNYTININIDKYFSDKMSTDELYKQILDGLKKLSK